MDMGFFTAYVHNREVLTNIQRDYGERVVIEWIPFFSEEGQERARRYNLSSTDWNCIIVNGKVVLGGGDKWVDEAFLREIIDAELTSPNLQKPETAHVDLWAILTALAFGILESFSPCVLVMLAFIVGYALGDKGQPNLRAGFLKVATFGAGFVFMSAVLIYACFLLSSPAFVLQSYLALAVCFFAIVLGANLLGLLKFPIQSKPIISKTARKYAFSYAGTFLLGIIFYFLDPCIAPIFAAMTAIAFPGSFIPILLFFCIGAVAPFIGVGLLVGSISKMVREAYKRCLLLRSASGAILMGYALYLLINLLFHLP